MRKKILYYIIFIIVVLLVLDVYALIRTCREIEGRCKSKREEFISASYDVPKLETPFVHVYNNDGELTNIVLISAPMNRAQREIYKRYKDGLLFLGISSYLEFPEVISNPFDIYNDPKHETWDFNYSETLNGWLHPFRNPEVYIKGDRPKILMSESDFADHNIIRPVKTEKRFDFIYICPKTEPNKDSCEADWTSYNKAWNFTLQCLEVMCKDFDMRGLLVGRKNCKLPRVCGQKMTTTDFLPWERLVKTYNTARFLFVPNQYDASPRVITEAMCCDLPIFVNNNILGGWKYVTDETGSSFNDLEDLSYKLHKFLNNLSSYSPRRHFIDNYGIINSGKKLLNFIATNYSGKTSVSRFNEYLTIRFPKPNFKYDENAPNVIDDIGDEIVNRVEDSVGVVKKIGQGIKREIDKYELKFFD